MSTHPHPTSLKSSESALVSWLVGTVLVLVAALIVGGYWLNAQRADEAALRAQAEIYQNYLRNTRAQVPSAEAPMPVRSEAQETRQYLLSHPAVIPGPAFDQPGVQSTGKAIVQAIDQAKGL